MFGAEGASAAARGDPSSTSPMEAEQQPLTNATDPFTNDPWPEEIFQCDVGYPESINLGDEPPERIRDSPLVVPEREGHGGQRTQALSTIQFLSAHQPPRTRSPPTSITPNNRNATQQSNHVNQSNGQSARASVQLSDRSRHLAAKYGIDLTESRPVR